MGQESSKPSFWTLVDILYEVSLSLSHFLVENICCRKAWAEWISIGFFVGGPKKEAKNEMSLQNKLPSSCKKLVLSWCGGINWWVTKRLFDLLLPMLHSLFKCRMFSFLEDKASNFLHTNRSSNYYTECVKFLTLISQSYATLQLSEGSMENSVGRRNC